MSGVCKDANPTGRADSAWLGYEIDRETTKGSIAEDIDNVNLQTLISQEQEERGSQRSMSQNEPPARLTERAIDRALERDDLIAAVTRYKRMEDN